MLLMAMEFGLFFSLLQWHIKLCGLFNAKVIVIEEQQWYYLTRDQSFGAVEYTDCISAEG